MNSVKEDIENGGSKIHLSLMVTTRLQKWSERAISHVKAAKEPSSKSVQSNEKESNSPEKILPHTNQIKELESALTELVTVHLNGSPTRQISLNESDTVTDIKSEQVLCQKVLDQNKEEHKESKTKGHFDDSTKEENDYKRTSKPNESNKSTLSSSDVVIKRPVLQESSKPGQNHVGLVRGSPHVHKKYQPAKLIGKLGSNETKSSEVSPVTIKCAHEEEECCNQVHCTSVNKNTRNKQIIVEENMKSQDDSMASKRPLMKRPVLKKHKSEGDILKQRVQMSLDFKDADICAFAAECLKAADLKQQQQRKNSRNENIDSSPSSGKVSTSPESVKKHQKQRQPRKTSKTEVSSSPPNSQLSSPRRQSFECGSPRGRTIHKVTEDEEVENNSAKDHGQRQLEIATKKLEKLIRKTETNQENHEDKRHCDLRSNVSRKDSTDYVFKCKEGEEVSLDGENCSKIPIKLDTEELKTDKIEVKSIEANNRKMSRDDVVKREEYEKTSSRKNSTQEGEITLKSYKSLARDSICTNDGKNQGSDSGKKTLERLEMLRQDLNSKPKPKLHKFPSLPLFYTPSGMTQEYATGNCTEARAIDDTLIGMKNEGLSKEKEEIGVVMEDERKLSQSLKEKTQTHMQTYEVGSSHFYVNEVDHEKTIALSTGTKTGLSTFYKPMPTVETSLTQS